MSIQKGYVTRDEIRAARAAPLYEFLVAEHMALFKRSGSSLYMARHDGIYIRQGFPGFNDFSSGGHGNPIDFLMKHLGYGFVDAVRSLNDFCPASAGEGKYPGSFPDETLSIRNHPEQMRLPEAALKPYRNMYAYLQKRGIPARFIKYLEEHGLAYQEKNTNNIVFISREKDYCELRGTFTYGSHPYHGCRKSAPDRFWHLSVGTGKTETAYICEAAIDAISLCILHTRHGVSSSTMYVSIGGVANQKTILRVKGNLPVILAVDNDNAGEACRRRNPDLPSIIPVHKDWNEDLLSYVN